MMWRLTNRADPRAAALADRHYSRQSHGARQFTPPGRVLVLVTADDDAVWATSWPYPRYVNRALPDAWVCTLFRNESLYLSSEMIRAAVAATRWRFGEAPPDGMVTMVDRAKVRRKRDYGRCYRKAGFVPAGETKSGLLILQLRCEEMPPPAAPLGAQLSLMEVV